MDVDAVSRGGARWGGDGSVRVAERLDLDDVYIERATDAGCLLSIDTDAHSRSNYDLMEYGVHAARRGWATAVSYHDRGRWRSWKRG